jgi:hypothetical protein
MPDLPRIPLRLTRPDLLIEVFCFIVLLESWTYAVYTFNHLPDSIPVFYKLASDNLGDLNEIWIFPILATLIFIAISWISCFPHKFKYKESVTRINAKRVYRKAVRRLRIIKLILVSICGLGVLTFAYFAGQQLTERSSTFPILSFILLVLPTIYLLHWVYSSRKPKY